MKSNKKFTILFSFLFLLTLTLKAQGGALNQSSGTISLHSEYVNNMDVSWQINVGSQNPIAFFYNSSTESGYDYIYIYEAQADGSYNVNNPIKVLNGQVSGSVCTTVPSGRAVVRFKSDGSVCYPSYSGFDIQFMAASTTNLGYNVTVSNNCIVNGKVGIGSANPDQKLTVKGKIHAEEVIVDLAVPADYVFQPSYKLRPLSEVEQYVKTNSHLPEIPSAKEIVQNGLSIGEMQNKLLQKVEELTLYVIQQQKKIGQLEKALEAKGVTQP